MGCYTLPVFMVSEAKEVLQLLSFEELVVHVFRGGDKKFFLCYPYYRFDTLFDNKDFLVIANDNKETDCFSYYRFDTLLDNKDFLVIANDNKETDCFSYYRFDTLLDNKDFMMENSSRKRVDTGRAGTYINQIGGYKAFVPKPLPPDPPIQLDEEMVFLLSLAERALGRLDGASGILPNADLFVAMYVNKEAVLSSQKVTGLTYANANNLIAKFQENGLLDQMDTYQRNRRFVYSSYLNMFIDDQVLEVKGFNTLETDKE